MVHTFPGGSSPAKATVLGQPETSEPGPRANRVTPESQWGRWVRWVQPSEAGGIPMEMPREMNLPPQRHSHGI